MTTQPVAHACPPSRRAVVLGGSLAGLLAARALADHYAEVVVLERDAAFDPGRSRAGTPHAAHPHGLLAGGLRALETLLPGFTAAMHARGALLADLQADVAFHADGAAFAAGRAGDAALCVSRAALEHEVRRRVTHLPAVQLRVGVTWGPPMLDAAGNAVAGVPVLSATTGVVSEHLLAAVVVDASGRLSRASEWLRRWDYVPPPEDRVEADVGYASVCLRRGPGLDVGDGVGKPLVIGCATPAQPRSAVLIAQEPDRAGTPRWLAALGGYGPDAPLPTLQVLQERAHEVGNADLRRVLARGELMAPIRTHRFSHSRRLRCERAARWPEGLLLIGDALAAVNPVYGQGMTLAARQAVALQQALAEGGDGLARRYHEACAPVVDSAWRITAGGDLALTAVPGPRPLHTRAANAYLGRVRTAARRHPAVSLALQRVVHLMAPPSTLLAPAIVWHALTASAAPRAR